MPITFCIKCVSATINRESQIHLESDLVFANEKKKYHESGNFVVTKHRMEKLAVGNFICPNILIVEKRYSQF